MTFECAKLLSIILELDLDSGRYTLKHKLDLRPLVYGNLISLPAKHVL